MKRWIVPGLPFVLSLGLSAFSVGSHIYWQDSGFYLTAVHDLGVLYPHGFVVYQLLCKAWTSLLFFVDFVLAVHLFSSVCAAAAAAVTALAVRDFTGKEWAGAVSGCVLAAGYTFWFSGLYAKVYALLYLVLAALLWAVVRTAAAPTRRGALLVAGLAGLAWAVHPSVALGGIGLAYYFFHASKSIGWKPTGAALALGLAVALAPGLLLPLLSARDVETSMGQPRSLSDVFAYLLGSRFTAIPGVFGFEKSRLVGFATFLWEEYLAVGLLLIAHGVVSLVRDRRPAAIGGLLWMLPYVVVTILFKIEGQSDHWYLAACLPLMLALGAWLAKAPERWMPLAAALMIVPSVAVNWGSLSLRNDDLAEVYGKLYLQNLEPDAILFAQSDDVLSTTRALQSVRGHRRDVLLVSASQLGSDELWYDRCLQRHHPDLRLPTSVGDRPDLEAIVSGYLHANAGGRRPLYVTMPLRAESLPRGHVLVPQGVVWRLLPASEDRVRSEHWEFPIEPEAVLQRLKRARGLAVTALPGGFEVESEAYELRLVKALIKARSMLADWQFRHGQHATAARLYESVVRLDPKALRNEAIVHSMALCYLGTGNAAQAESAFRLTLDVATRPWTRASSWLALGDLAKGRGDAARARTCYEEASRIPNLTPEQQAAVRSRLER